MQAYCVKYTEGESREAIVVSLNMDAMVSYFRSQHRSGVRLLPTIEVPIIEIPEGSFAARVLKMNNTLSVSNLSHDYGTYLGLTRQQTVGSEMVRLPFVIPGDDLRDQPALG